MKDQVKRQLFAQAVFEEVSGGNALDIFDEPKWDSLLEDMSFMGVEDADVDVEECSKYVGAHLDRIKQVAEDTFAYWEGQAP